MTNKISLVKRAKMKKAETEISSLHMNDTCNIMTEKALRARLSRNT
jgi:hypothetical protein